MTIVLALMAFPVLAKPCADNGVNAGSNIQVYLVHKDPSTWDVLGYDVFGKVNINVKQETFVCNAHGLTEGDEYYLVNYYRTGSWANNRVVILGDVGVVNEGGNLQIKGDIAFPLYSDPSDPESSTGAKLWLVPVDDVEEYLGEYRIGSWNPADILFEECKITYAEGIVVVPDALDVRQITMENKDAAWAIIGDDGMYGVFTINMESGAFIFEGYGLAAGTNYDLINYDQDDHHHPMWLADVTTDSEGNVIITGTATLPLLSHAYTAADTTDGTEYDGQTGSKIWLVLEDDYNDATGYLVEPWGHRSEVLWETALIIA